MSDNGRGRVDTLGIAAQFPDLQDLTLLAQGAQKVVFAAKHVEEGDVVLKLLLQESGNARLDREILAGRLVGCERVPTIHETGTLSTPLRDCTWVREERVHGTTLRTCLNSGPVGIEGVIHLGRQVLKILCASEQRRIVHRDIKPENIMRDQSGEFWLLDFGLARHLDLESLTATHQHFGVGTPGYSAPEQMRNKKRQIDTRADLFALGITMYEYGTGSNPFIDGARDPLEILRRVESLVLPAFNVAGDPSDSLRDLVAALTQKYPTQRPRTAQETQVWLEDIARQMTADVSN